MISRSMPNTAIDQSGKPGIERSAPTALKLAAMMPIQRPNWPPDQIENAANSWSRRR